VVVKVFKELKRKRYEKRVKKRKMLEQSKTFLDMEHGHIVGGIERFVEDEMERMKILMGEELFSGFVKEVNNGKEILPGADTGERDAGEGIGHTEEHKNIGKKQVAGGVRVPGRLEEDTGGEGEA